MNKKRQQDFFVVDVQNNHLLSLASSSPSVSALQNWACAVFQYQGLSAAEITLRLVDNIEMQQLNARYRHKNSVTNVLAFPAQIPMQIVLEIPLLGDIILCVPVIHQEAQQQEKPLLAHWAHMIVHGVLHLLGYDHINQQEARLMEDKEILILKELNFSNPYA